MGQNKPFPRVSAGSSCVERVIVYAQRSCRSDRPSSRWERRVRRPPAGEQPRWPGRRREERRASPRRPQVERRARCCATEPTWPSVAQSCRVKKKKRKRERERARRAGWLDAGEAEVGLECLALSYGGSERVGDALLESRTRARERERAAPVSLSSRRRRPPLRPPAHPRSADGLSPLAHFRTPPSLRSFAHYCTLAPALSPRHDGATPRTQHFGARDSGTVHSPSHSLSQLRHSLTPARECTLLSLPTAAIDNADPGATDGASETPLALLVLFAQASAHCAPLVALFSCTHSLPWLGLANSAIASYSADPAGTTREETRAPRPASSPCSAPAPAPRPRLDSLSFPRSDHPDHSLTYSPKTAEARGGPALSSLRPSRSCAVRRPAVFRRLVGGSDRNLTAGDPVSLSSRFFARIARWTEGPRTPLALSLSCWSLPAARRTQLTSPALFDDSHADGARSASPLTPQLHLLSGESGSPRFSFGWDGAGWLSPVAMV